MISMISKDSLRAQFQKLYSTSPRIFSAPGRVNLIGEHTDYNDGFVLPMAIDRRTLVAASPRHDRLVRCASIGFDGDIEFQLSADLQPMNDWGNHIRGVAACLMKDEYELRGADLLIASDIPAGSGLSSSAALEVAAGYALLTISDEAIDLVDLALASQRAEQEFTGTKCGIMDQYMACLGVKGHALLLDCRSLEYRAIPIDLTTAHIVVCNSMVKHDLADGEYNRRRAECEEGVNRLRAHIPGIYALRDVELEEFDLYCDSLPPIITRRCNHVITENARTIAAVEALERGDFVTFGKLMYASHESLRDDYQVSCPELDILVDLASKIDGVFGARMTGGGFGGCTVNLVAAGAVENFISTIGLEYEKTTSNKPECYIFEASEGVRPED